MKDFFYGHYDDVGEQKWQRKNKLMIRYHELNNKKELSQLEHEFEDLTLMKKGKYNYKEAHELANKKFNWEDVIK